jgi:cysteinyl-tRNA synthetase
VLQLFDTAQGKVVPFEPREPGKVSMYVCGPTVYGPPHLGHGRFSLVFDVLRRYLRWSGFDVTYVSNITDIDDKIINRANDEGRDWRDIATRCEDVWWTAMEAIGVERPDHDPHATAYVPEMVELIGRLIKRGDAYVSDDGVYFSPAVVDDYGLLARQTLESLQAGARVEVAEHKRSPIDFALWKFAKPGEPSWPSPWGDGRPGWHTECVVMSLDLLGDGFDIHGGGLDLAFPHHENERAQAVAAGRTFARHWVHNGFVEVGGEKMSKSLGNFTNLLDLVESTDPRAYRLLVLRAHYRTPLEISKATTDDATAALKKLDSLARSLADADLPSVPGDAEALERFRAAMDADLDTPRVMALLSEIRRRANTALDMEDRAEAASLGAAFLEISGALGLVLDAGGDEVPAEVLAVARQRDDARAAKDWAQADALRDQLVADGWVVEDTPSGTQVRPA